MATHSSAQSAFTAGLYLEALDLTRKGGKADPVLELEILQLVGRVSEATEEAERLVKLGRLTNHEQSRCFAIIAASHFEEGNIAAALACFRRALRFAEES